MPRTISLDSLEEILAVSGFQEAGLESQGSILLLRLKADDLDRFLTQTALRARVVQEAKRVGFSRVAVELDDPKSPSGY